MKPKNRIFTNMEERYAKEYKKGFFVGLIIGNVLAWGVVAIFLFVSGRI